MAIAANLCLAKQHMDQALRDAPRTRRTQLEPKNMHKLFGVGFTPRTRCFSLKPMWTPPPMVHFQSTLLEYIRAKEGPCTTVLRACFFGHPTANNKYTQNLVPIWRGACLGAELCWKCHRLMTHELNDIHQPLITTYGLPPSALPFTGPCSFGHLHSSSQGTGGVQVCHRMPQGCSWEGAESGDTLCNACYVKFKRKSDKGHADIIHVPLTAIDTCSRDGGPCAKRAKLCDLRQTVLSCYKVRLAGIWMKQNLGGGGTVLCDLLDVCLASC